jgi:hypothetical protein
MKNVHYYIKNKMSETRKWYVRYDGKRWEAAKNHHIDAINLLITQERYVNRGSYPPDANFQRTDKIKIEVPHSLGGMFVASFDVIQNLPNGNLYTTYTREDNSNVEISYSTQDIISLANRTMDFP